MDGGFAIETSALAKRFGSVSAVSGIDLRVPHGSVYGFLGPNGAGKTTTIRMLLGLVGPSSGTVTVLGRRVLPGAVDLEGVGAGVERPAFYPYLSAADNLRLLAITHGTEPHEARRIAADALAWAGLSAVAKRKVGGFSTGMRQRLALAHAMLHRPRLVILDEPTNGLDPAGVVEVRDLISGMARDGVTVFLSSHVLSEVEQVCSHVAVLRAGLVVADGPKGQVVGGPGTLAVRFDTPHEAQAALRVLAEAGIAASGPRPTSPALAGSADSPADPSPAQLLEACSVVVALPADQGSRVARVLARAELYPASLVAQRQSLESVFLELTRDQA